MWIIFKAFIEFVTMLLLFFIYWFFGNNNKKRDLSLLTGAIGPGPPYIRRWSLNHWATREVPWFNILIDYTPLKTLNIGYNPCATQHILVAYLFYIVVCTSLSSIPISLLLPSLSHLVTISSISKYESMFLLCHIHSSHCLDSTYKW